MHMGATQTLTLQTAFFLIHLRIYGWQARRQEDDTDQNLYFTLKQKESYAFAEAKSDQRPHHLAQNTNGQAMPKHYFL